MWEISWAKEEEEGVGDGRRNERIGDRFHVRLPIETPTEDDIYVTLCRAKYDAIACNSKSYTASTATETKPYFPLPYSGSKLPSPQERGSFRQKNRGGVTL
jgi:hypothetical protein